MKATKENADRWHDMRFLIDSGCVFLSGPMTGVPDHNRPEFVRAHAALVDMGAVEVFDPATRYINERGKDHKWYMRKCLRHLLWSKRNTLTGEWINKPYWSCLVSLPGWKSSKGAVVERMVAKSCGIECIDWSELKELCEIYGR